MIVQRAGDRRNVAIAMAYFLKQPTVTTTTHDVSRSGCHIADIHSWLTQVQEIVKAVFPNSSKSRYSAVHVLLLSWEDDDLKVNVEVDQLQNTFEKWYGFNVSNKKIPSEKAHSALGRVIRDFSERLGQGDNLLIVYYGGHGYLNESRQPIWLCNQQPDSPSVKWFAHQTDLEEVEADTLILLDCCHAGGSDGDVAKGTKEVIAACGFNAGTPGVGDHSFTKSLIDTLKSLSSGPSFTASSLHHRVLERLKNWNPLYNAVNWTEMNKEGRLHDMERRECPIYISLNKDTKRRSIEISPLTSQKSTIRINSNDSNLDRFPKETTEVTISLQIESGQVFCPQDIVNWIREVPVLAQSVKLGAVMNSHSTLVILSLPVAVWNLLPDDPACCFVGFTTSRNLLLEDNHDTDLRTAADEVRSASIYTSYKSPSSEFQPRVGISASSPQKGLRNDTPEAKCLEDLKKLYGREGVYSKAFSEASQSNEYRVEDAVCDSYCDAIIEVSGLGYDVTLLELLNMGADMLADVRADTVGDSGAEWRAKSKAKWRPKSILAWGDGNRTQKYGSATYIASRNGHDKAVQGLLDRKVPIHSEDLIRALLQASYHGYDKVVQVLLEKSTIDAEGLREALLEAVERGNDKAVDVLLGKGAAINVEAVTNALLMASCQGHEEMVRVLLRGRSDVNVDQPIEQAHIRGHINVKRVLEEYKASYFLLEIVKKT